MLNKIYSMLLNKNYIEAIATCKEELKYDSSSAKLWYMLFLAENEFYYIDTIDYLKDEMAFNQAIFLADKEEKTLWSRECHVYRYLGSIPYARSICRNLQLQKLDEAKKMFLNLENDNKIYSINPLDKDAFYNDMYSLVEIQSDKEAILFTGKFFKKLYRLTNDLEALLACIKSYERIASLNNINAIIELANIYEEIGNPSKAEHYYKLMLDIFYNHQDTNIDCIKKCLNYFEIHGNENDKKIALSIANEYRIYGEDYCHNCRKIYHKNPFFCKECSYKNIKINYDINGKKSKKIATVLAIFLGFVGIHWLYLNQMKKFLSYIIVMVISPALSALIAIFDAIKFFKMTEEKFDEEYKI